MGDLGGPLEHSKSTKLAKIGNCAHRGDQRVSRRLAGSILNVILGDFLDVIQQFGIINGLREREQGRTRKDQGNERGRARKNILHNFSNLIRQLLTRNGVRRTWKEQGRSTIAMKQGRTRK